MIVNERVVSFINSLNQEDSALDTGLNRRPEKQKFQLYGQKPENC